MHLTLPILSLTEAEWAARTKPLGSRQLGHNQTTGEFRKGPGLWHACTALGARANTEVVAATTANITIATALNNGDTLDGVTLATGDLVLVKDQSTASQNGIYVVGTSPARASAYDTWAEHVGKLIRVKGGSSHKNKHFRCNVLGGGTLNTTDIGFDEEPIGTIDFANASVVDSLPKRDQNSTSLATHQLLMLDPTTNQLCTITAEELAGYVASTLE